MDVRGVSMKRLLIAFMLVIALLSCAACSDTESDSNDNSDSEAVSESVSEDNEYIEDNLNKQGQKAFIKACKDINLDVNQIDSMEQLDDWASGERFTFGYKTANLKLYMLSDDSVDSISIYGVKVFKRGYEPYDINDYIIDYEMATDLQYWAKEDVKKYLNRPETADFGWFDWAYNRNGEVYGVKSTVKAKNFFNAKDKVSFVAQYKVTEDSHKLIYLELDGNVYCDNGRIKEKERKPLDTGKKKSSKSSSNIRIVLSDGEKGEYGKLVESGGEKYYHYYVPNGDYKAVCKIPCTVFVVGEDPNDVKSSKALSENDTASISVPNGYHIELSMNGKIVLSKK